jgi:hypothetical protein
MTPSSMLFGPALSVVLPSSSSSSRSSSMVEAVTADEDVRAASGSCSRELLSSGMRRRLPSPHSDQKGVGHLLPLLRSAVQASLSLPHPKWLRSPVVVRWAVRSNFVGSMEESSRT